METVTSQKRPPAADTEVTDFLACISSILDQLDRPTLTVIVDRLYRAWLERRTVFVMGNGGSAGTASHFAADLAKYTIVGAKPRFRVLGLTDNVPLVSAWTNDSGWSSIFAEQMEPWLEPGDVLVGFSVHGGSGTGDAGPWSQNIVRAMAAARAAGASVIGFSGYDGGAMREMAEHCLTVPALIDELGTPVIEGVHVVLHHLVVHALRKRIEAYE